MEEPLSTVLPSLEVPRDETPVLPSLEAARTEPARYPGLAALPNARVRTGASDVALFTGATFAAQVVMFIAGVIQKRLLGPTAFGYWSLMSTFQIFFTLVTLGSLAGAGRQIPFHRGRGDRGSAARVSDTGSSFAIVTDTVAGVLVVAVALLFGSHWPTEIRYGLVGLGVLAPLLGLTNAHATVTTGVKRFDAASLILIVQALLSLTVQTLFVWLWGYYGMFAGLAVSAVGALVVWNRLGLTSFRAPVFRWSIQRSRLRELIRYGIPIMLNGQIWQLFLVVDNLIVVSFLDVKHLGYYALACSATTYIMLLPQAIGGALAPRMSERYGKTGAEASIRHYATDVQMMLAQVALPVMVGAMFFLLPVLIRHGLPQFVPAIPVLRIMLAGSFFISLSNMPIKILLAGGHRWSVTALTSLALAVNAVANYVAVGLLHGGLDGAALAVVFSYLATFLILTGFALTRTLPPRAVALHIGGVIATFAYLAGAMWGIEALIGPGGGGVAHDSLIGAAKLLLLAGALTPMLILAERRFKVLTGLVSRLREIKSKQRPVRGA